MTERLKVVRIIARLNVGGPARHVALLERHLRDHGYDSVLVHGVLHDGERELPPGPPARAIFVAPLGRAVRLGGDVRALWRLIGIVFREKPDVVHTHTTKAGTLGRLAAFAYNRTVPRARRCAVIHTFHGHVFRGYFGPRASRFVQRTERLLARLADRLVAVSEGQRRELVDVFRIAPAAKVVVVPLGLDLDPLTAVADLGGGLREEAGFDGEAIVCGYVGRLVPIKNVELLLEACAEAFESVRNGRLLIVGDGECRARLQRRIVQLNLEGRVHFAGWRSDLAEVYAAMSIVALSSRNEGTPVALIEAMAAGRAVVATSVGGVPEVVTAGVTGLLVPDGDRVGLSAALVRLLRDDHERQRLGAAAREDVVRRYGYRRLVADIDRLYRDTLNSVRGGASAAGAGR